MGIVVPGFADSVKTPGAYGAVAFGQSQIRYGSGNNKLLLIGLKGASGDLVLDNEVRRVISNEEADTAAGPGGELARMAYAAIEETKGMTGVEIYLMAVTGAAGTAATLIATFSGTSTAAGVINVSVAGLTTEITIPISTAAATAAALVNTKLGTVAHLAATSGVSTTAVTLTDKSASVRGNQMIVYVDFSGCPGITCVLSGTGGAAVTSSATVVGRTFGSGTGTETLTAAQTALLPTFHKFYAPAQNDATSLASWELNCDAKALPGEGKKEHYVIANSGNFAAATSIAQTTLNNARFSLKWLEVSETPPCEIAAAIAAVRSATEQGSTVNSMYDGYAYRTIKPQRFPSDWNTSNAEKEAALAVGVSPLETKADGKVYEVRSITTRCLDGASADYRTLDTSDSFVPDYCNERLCLVWTSEYQPANTKARPDPAANEPDLPAGVATPLGWSRRANAEMRRMENELIAVQTVLNPVESDWNYTANRIMSVNPVVPYGHAHQLGLLTKQIALSA